MIALRRLVFGSRKFESNLHIHVIVPPNQDTEQPESTPVTVRPTRGRTSLDRLYANRHDTQTTWYRLGGR